MPRPARSLARLTRAFAPLALVWLLGCRSAAPPTPAPSPKDDEPAIVAILAADANLDRALKQADDEAAKGNDSLAADTLEKTALPAASDAIALAERQTVRSAWGLAQKNALISLLRDRKAEIPRYAAALRGGDLEAKLAATQAEVALEQRALEVTRAAATTPE